MLGFVALIQKMVNDCVLFLKKLATISCVVVVSWQKMHKNRRNSHKINYITHF